MSGSGAVAAEGSGSLAAILQSRANHHQGWVENLVGLITNANINSEPHLRVAQALHDLGVTIAAAAMPVEEIKVLDQERVAAMEAFRVALKSHGEAIDKATKGLSPWGEIKDAHANLKLATARLEALL